MLALDFRTIKITMLFLMVTCFITLHHTKAAPCSVCVYDYCQTSFPTTIDLDGDGISDYYEDQLVSRPGNMLDISG